MNNFLSNLEQTTSKTLTENGAQAVNTTGNALVDLFGVAGAMREREDFEIQHKFLEALTEDVTLSTKLAFYTRDVREGLGERRAGRIMLKMLAERYPELIIKNIHLFKEYGRFDDLFILFDTPCEEAMIQYVMQQFREDMENMAQRKPISLLAKWMPSVNTSSRQTRALAKKFIKKFDAKSDKPYTERKYRKMLSRLRRYIDVVEVKMSANKWEQINYEAVPSNAMTNYRNAFQNRDEKRFSQYIDKVSSGEAKINSSVLYPYNIVEKFLYPYNGDKVLEEQWKALPNYIDGENNILVMADVSGSMMGRPMATSIGLAIYFAERNKGMFANKYMTFTNKPSLVTIKDGTLHEKIKQVERTDVGYNTDLEAAFEAVLEAAKRGNCKQEEMPMSLVIITDMEIDDYSISGGNLTFLEEMKTRFADAGYELPNVVFWNVNSRHDTYHAFEGNTNVQLVSGQSTSTFKLVLDGTHLTPHEMMLKALNAERYDLIDFSSLQ